MCQSLSSPKRAEAALIIREAAIRLPAAAVDRQVAQPVLESRLHRQRPIHRAISARRDDDGPSRDLGAEDCRVAHAADVRVPSVRLRGAIACERVDDRTPASHDAQAEAHAIMRMGAWL